MEKKEEKKILVEHNGKTEEVSQEKLQEMQTNPDYQVEKKEENKYKVKERLLG